MALTGMNHIKVNIEELKGKAESMAAILAKMRADLQIMTDVMQRTSGYWVGEAGDKYRDLYMEEKEEITEILRRLSEHPNDLLSMAGVYRKTIIDNSATAQGMPTNVIN